MAPYIPTAVELEKGLDDVYYEIEQLAATAVGATNLGNLNNAIIESRLLHVRTLMDFFEESPQPQDDILSTHYGFPARKVPIDAVYRERLNKDLAHLTYSRTKRTAADKWWPQERVVLPILEVCQSFIGHVLASRSTFSILGRTDWENLRTGVSNLILVTTGLHSTAPPFPNDNARLERTQ